MTQLRDTDRIIAEADDLVQFERAGIVYAYFPATDTAVPWDRYIDERRHQRSQAGVAAWRQLAGGVNKRWAVHERIHLRMERRLLRLERAARLSPLLGGLLGATLVLVLERLIG